VHQLSDSDWAWCEREVAAVSPPPPRAQSTRASALYVLLGVLDDYLQREYKRLFDVFVRGRRTPMCLSHPRSARSGWKKRFARMRERNG
jgi:hypothetical protein